MFTRLMIKSLWGQPTFFVFIFTEKVLFSYHNFLRNNPEI